MDKLLKQIFLIFLLLPADPAWNQIVVQGTIQDRETGQFLPAANIQIEGTYRGTITNEQGEFRLPLDDLPVTLIISYIGYATSRLEITKSSPRYLAISLQPIAYEMEPIVVTDEDPALRIMREVIRRKQKWRAGLQTFQAEAYTRLVLENDTSITSIMESISTAYWDKGRGIREIVRSRRQTSNLTENENFASVGIITNLYDDNIEIAGFILIGVTHPEALDHYHFHLEGTRKRDEKLIYDISVKPKSKLQPTFEGRIAVLDSVYALLEVDLKPGEAVLFPTPIQNFDLHYVQQFNNFGTEYWLPIDIRVNGSIKIGFIGLQFPNIIIKRISRLTDYQINVSLPDSLYRLEQTVTVDSSRLHVNPDTVFTANPEVVPYSTEEQTAYTRLDSTMTLVKAYKPSGPLARFVKMEVEDGNEDSETGTNQNILSNISPIVTFDRVDAFTIGLNKDIDISQINFHLFAGYKTGRKDWFYGAKADIPIKKNKQWQLLLKYYDKTDTRYSSNAYPMLFTSIHTLLGYRDYFDFYRNKKFHLSTSYAFSAVNSRITLGYNYETHRSLEKNSDFNILGRNIVQRENPAIPEGRLQSLQFEFFSDEEYIPLGFIGQNYWKLFAEFSSPEFLDSDFDFLRLALMVDVRIATFLRRRLLPNTLDIHFVGGTHQGELPPQRFGMIDGTLKIFSPFSVLRTLNSLSYEGEDYLGIFWEHNFRTVPFELLGLRFLAERNIGIILHGASANTRISGDTRQTLAYMPVLPEKTHHELGLSINGIFDLFRIDFTHRLDSPDFWIGFSFSRLF
jgi:hypothetical protein